MYCINCGQARYELHLDGCKNKRVDANNPAFRSVVIIEDCNATNPVERKPILSTFFAYNEEVSRHVRYPMVGSNMVYPSLKLAGEAGECADKIGKHWRNSHAEKVAKFSTMRESEILHQSMGSQSMDAILRDEIAKELGDVLWYINAIANEMGMTLEQIAIMNADKLAGRAKRGTILSRGDNR